MDETAWRPGKDFDRQVRLSMRSSGQHLSRRLQVFPFGCCLCFPGHLNELNIAVFCRTSENLHCRETDIFTQANRSPVECGNRRTKDFRKELRFREVKYGVKKS